MLFVFLLISSLFLVACEVNLNQNGATLSGDDSAIKVGADGVKVEAWPHSIKADGKGTVEVGADGSALKIWPDGNMTVVEDSDEDNSSSDGSKIKVNENWIQVEGPDWSLTIDENGAAMNVNWATMTVDGWWDIKFDTPEGAMDIEQGWNINLETSGVNININENRGTIEEGATIISTDWENVNIHAPESDITVWNDVINVDTPDSSMNIDEWGINININE